MDRTGNFTAALDITAYSDKRIKTDIKRIEGALDKVSQIGGYTFMRTDEVSKGQRQAGVLAQELLEVLPEVVRVNEETGYYTVSYGNITALLIEALKEERQKRESLEEFLRSLEERVKFLEQK
jgi:ABC-type glutathione transport system ATPase component